MAKRLRLGTDTGGTVTALKANFGVETVVEYNLYLALRSFGVDWERGALMLRFSPGTYSTAGKFYPYPGYKDFTYAIHKRGNPVFWENNIETATIFNVDTILSWLLSYDLVQVAATQWGITNLVAQLVDG